MPFKIQIGLALLLAAFVGIFAYGQYERAQGKREYRETLLKARVITKDQVRSVDNEVFSADESALCVMLGGCELPDESADN